MTISRFLSRHLCGLMVLLLLAALLPASALAVNGDDLISDLPTNAGVISTGSLLPEKSVSQNGISLMAETDAGSYDHAHDAEIAAAVQNRQTTLDTSSWVGLTKDNYKEIVTTVLNDHPEFFWFRSYSGAYYPSSGKVARITFNYYSFTDEQISAFDDALVRAKAELDAQLTESATDAEKVLLIHDYLVSNIAYDKLNLDNDSLPDTVFNMYGVLVNHSAVCQGYAETFLYFMQYYGIPCRVASSSKVNHAWNVVYLDGNWYHVDATWDDPTWDLYGRVNHNYLLLSTATLLSKSPGRSDFVTQTSYDSVVFTNALDSSCESGQLWNSVFTRMVCDGVTGSWYYLKNGILYQSSFSGSDATQVFALPSNRWSLSDSSAYYSNQGKLTVSGRLLYISAADCIYVYNMDTGASHVYYTPDTSSSLIYGLTVEDGQLGYALESSPNLSGPETLIPITGSNALEAVHTAVEQGEGTEPTCGQPGSAPDTFCTVCLELISVAREIPATGLHTYSYQVTELPTAFSAGVLQQTCSVCGDTAQLEIPALSPEDYTLDPETLTYSWKDNTYTEDVFTFTGDLNMDCAVSLVDVALLYQVYTGRARLSNPALSADLNGDGRVNLLDTARLFRMITA